MMMRRPPWDPLAYWREWWRELALIEQAVVIVTLVMGIAILIVSPALAADTDGSQMSNIWTVLIIAVVSGTVSPALLQWMRDRSDARKQLADAEFKRNERLATEAREDAREARTQAALETIKKQTDGVVSQVAALAKSTGRLEGGAEATKAAEGTAATLALGQQQGRDAERESVATKLKQDSDAPLPVVDKITNETGERAAAALERMASTAHDAAKEKKA